MKGIADHLRITDTDVYVMGKGEWFRSYEKMGAHPTVVDGVSGFNFAVWAPEVRSVCVVGSFNDWQEGQWPLRERETGGVWEGFVPGVAAGDLYKYVIETASGERLYKADPYGFWAEEIPGTASRACDEPAYEWGDGAWMDGRAKADHMHRPLNIYEVHAGSWRRHGDEPQGDPDENGNYPGPMDPFPAQRGRFYSYDDLARELPAYVGDMGYTHVELLPLMEHPFDGSWGYQTTGYYAPTARYGDPDGLRRLVDALHQAGIGVILDWTPGGFCADAQGLATFNGTMLYEREIHPNWGTHKFDFGRGEVRSFLISNVLYWIERFHVDGIRMDGVSSMLYLNFGVDDPSQKKFNKYGDEGDLDAIDFIRKVNATVGGYHPDVMMIAEESTAWPLVTYPPEEGGLGFHYKWDMGWMNDTLHYMQTDFPWRPGNHKLLTFSLMYAFNENFVLPLSHDEVVHGKCSLITRMPGDYWRQFAGMRALALYQMTHPGAKLNFMGNEIAQWIEWRYYESIQWFLADEYEAHRKQRDFVRALNHLYLEEPAFWQHAYEWEGFDWIDADDADQSIISFVRHGDERRDDLVVLINFDPRAYEEYRIGVPTYGTWAEVFNSDDERYGGSGVINTGKAEAEDASWNGQEQSVVVRVPPLGGMILKCIKPKAKPKRPARKPKAAATKRATAGKDKAAKASASGRKAPAKSGEGKAPTKRKKASSDKKAGAGTKGSAGGKGRARKS